MGRAIFNPLSAKYIQCQFNEFLLLSLPLGYSLYTSFKGYELKQILNNLNLKYPIRNKKSESFYPFCDFLNIFSFFIPYLLFLIFLYSSNSYLCIKGILAGAFFLNFIRYNKWSPVFSFQHLVSFLVVFKFHCFWVKV